MRTNGQTFNDNRTATATELACSGGSDGRHLSTGALSLVLKHRPERAQSRVVGGQGQVAVAGHEREGQILNSDIAVAVDDPAGGLMPELAPRVSDTLMQHSDLTGSLVPVGTTLLATGHATLSHAQVGQVVPQPARIVDDRSIGQRQQVVDTHVDADIGPVGDDGIDIGQFQHEADVPLAKRALDDDVLDRCAVGNLSMQDDLDLPDVLDVETVAIQLAPVAGTVFNRLEPLDVLESRMTGMTFVERLVSLIDPAEHLLDRRGIEHTHLVGQAMAFVTHPVPLLMVGDAAARPLPRLAALVERVVVDGLHLGEQAIEQVDLLLRRAQSVLVGANQGNKKAVRMLLFGYDTQTGHTNGQVHYSIRLCVVRQIIARMFVICKETALCAAHIPLPLERGSTL